MKLTIENILWNIFFGKIVSRDYAHILIIVAFSKIRQWIILIMLTNDIIFPSHFHKMRSQVTMLVLLEDVFSRGSEIKFLTEEN